MLCAPPAGARGPVHAWAGIVALAHIEPARTAPSPSGSGDGQTVQIAIALALLFLALALIIYAPILVLREVSSWRKAQQKKAIQAETKRSDRQPGDTTFDEQRRAQGQAWREAAAGEQAARRQQESARRQQESARPQQEPPGKHEQARDTRSSSSHQNKDDLDESYRILGLEPGASESLIRAAHRRLIVSFHTDHLPQSVNHQVRELVNEQMKKINIARDKLLAAVKRGG